MRNVAADLVLETEAALWLTMRVARCAGSSRRRERAVVCTARDGARQVLGLQTRRTAHQRSAGVPRRAGLHRRPHHAAPVSRGAGQFDLGGQRQRAVHRSVARFRNRRRRSMCWWTNWRRQWDPMRRSTRLRPDLRRTCVAASRIRSRRGCFAERMAVLLQASQLIRHSGDAIANAFVAARLGPRSLTYGALTDRDAVAELLARIELP